MTTGKINVSVENIFPLIKKFLYSDHEIFLRELISNGTDATLKLKHLTSIGEAKVEYGNPIIEVKIDKEGKKLHIIDQGIGMTSDEVEKYINQLAFSGAEEFLEKYKDSAKDSGIIGHKMDKQAREIDNALPGAEVERVGEGIKLVLNENAVRFDTNKSTLTAAAKANLDKLVKVFNEYPDTNIVIYGYTDSTGSAEYNLKLSGERAASVKNYLANKGLVASRFSVTGLGIADPIASNETPEGRSKNRRVEFAITANDKMIQEAKDGK